MSGRRLNDYAVGQTFDSPTAEITDEKIRAFAREFDPQPFHLDPETAAATLFNGLAASGWHTASLTMRLLLSSGFTPSIGIVGARILEMTWARPVRPGDRLHCQSEVLELIQEAKRPGYGMLKLRTRTLNQADKVVQEMTAELLVEK